MIVGFHCWWTFVRVPEGFVACFHYFFGHPSREYQEHALAVGDKQEFQFPNFDSDFCSSISLSVFALRSSLLDDLIAINKLSLKDENTNYCKSILCSGVVSWYSMKQDSSPVSNPWRSFCIILTRLLFSFWNIRLLLGVSFERYFRAKWFFLHSCHMFFPVGQRKLCDYLTTVIPSCHIDLSPLSAGFAN